MCPTDKSVYKTLGNNKLCPVGVLYGMITVFWYIPLVAGSVCPIRGVPGNCGSGGDSTRYYVTLQAMRLRAASVVCLYVIVRNCTILHNVITIIRACYDVYAQNGLFIFSTTILYMLNLSVNYNLKVSPRRNILIAHLQAMLLT